MPLIILAVYMAAHVSEHYFRVSFPMEEFMDKMQIEEKHYALELESDRYDGYSSYGIAFCGKDCCVRVR